MLTSVRVRVCASMRVWMLWWGAVAVAVDIAFMPSCESPGGGGQARDGGATTTCCGHWQKEGRHARTHTHTHPHTRADIHIKARERGRREQNKEDMWGSSALTHTNRYTYMCVCHHLQRTRHPQRLSGFDNPFSTSPVCSCAWLSTPMSTLARSSQLDFFIHERVAVTVL